MVVERNIRFLHDYIAGLASNSLMRSDILEREGSSRETMQAQLTTYYFTRTVWEVHATLLASLV